MSITERGHQTYLIRVYLGRDLLTNKRIEKIETFHGTLKEARIREAILKGKKHSGSVLNSSRMTVNELIARFWEARRHRYGVVSGYNLRNNHRRYFGAYLGNRQISKLTRTEIEEFLNFLLDPKPETKKETKDAPQQK